jgi:hypothetical protein
MNEYIFTEDLYQVSGQVLLILPRPWHNILADDKAQLAKMLAAIKVNEASLVMWSQPTVSIESIKVFNPGKVLIFGSKVSDDIQPYVKTDLPGGTLVWADDISEWDDGKKKSLWLVLRQMFGV